MQYNGIGEQGTRGWAKLFLPVSFREPLLAGSYCSSGVGAVEHRRRLAGSKSHVAGQGISFFRITVHLPCSLTVQTMHQSPFPYCIAGTLDSVPAPYSSSMKSIPTPSTFPLVHCPSVGGVYCTLSQRGQGERGGSDSRGPRGRDSKHRRDHQTGLNGLALKHRWINSLGLLDSPTFFGFSVVLPLPAPLCSAASPQSYSYGCSITSSQAVHHVRAPL